MGALWNPTADKLVCIFITAAFTGVIRMTVINLSSFHYFVVIALFHGVHIKKFHAIVTGNCFKCFTEYRSGKIALNTVKDF